MNEYIKFYKAENIPLRKFYTGNFNVHIPTETHVRMANLAQQAGVSLNHLSRRHLIKTVVRKIIN